MEITVQLWCDAPKTQAPYAGRVYLRTGPLEWMAAAGLALTSVTTPRIPPPLPACPGKTLQAHPSPLLGKDTQKPAFTSTLCSSVPLFLWSWTHLSLMFCCWEQTFLKYAVRNGKYVHGHMATVEAITTLWQKRGGIIMKMLDRALRGICCKWLRAKDEEGSLSVNE